MCVSGQSYDRRVKGKKTTRTEVGSAPVWWDRTTPSDVPVKLAAMDCAVILAVMSPRLLPPCSVKLNTKSHIAMTLLRLWW
jgi:hypothetical protein